MEKHYIKSREGFVVAVVPKAFLWEKSELSALADELRVANELVHKLHNGEITIGDIPQQWKEIIQTCLDELVQITEEATEADYQAALREMGVEV